MSYRSIRRPANDRVLAGVCSAVANALGIDPTLVRIGWVIFTLFGGSGLLAYLVAWFVIPDQDGRRAATPLVLLLLALVVPCICFLLSVPFRVLDRVF